MHSVPKGQTPAKAKIIVATEPMDRVTVRVTPERIGELLAKVPKSELKRVMQGYLGEHMFSTDDKFVAHIYEIYNQTEHIILALE